MTYARQVRPELQESPYMLGDDYPDDLILCGNRSYQEHTTEEYDAFLGNWEYVYEAMEYCRNGCVDRWYSTITEAIMDNFPPQHKQKYSSRDIHEWKSILEEMCYREDKETICKALQLMTGKSWSTSTIHGCSQGDWQTIIYCSDTWNSSSIREFEMMYFNLGTEWIIHDGDSVPESPEDIDGFSVYCATWDEDEARRILADAACDKPENVVMYAYDGDIVKAKYRVA